MNAFKISVACFALAAFVSCDEELIQNEPIPASSQNAHSNLSTEQDEFIYYEVYDAPSENVQMFLEDELIHLFSEGQSESSTEIRKGIWLWESGTNYLWPEIDFETDEVVINDYDSAYTVERNVSFQLVDSLVVNSALKYQFELTGNLIEGKLDSGSTHILTDVQFVEKVGDMIYLRVVSHFWVNPVYVTEGTAVVFSDGWLGESWSCSGTPYIRVWQEMERKAKKETIHALHPDWDKWHGNIVAFDTYQNNPFNQNTLLPCDYLPGNLNAIFPAHEQGVVTSYTCCYGNQVSAYAWAIADQLNDLIAKQTYWDGLVLLFVTNGNNPQTSTVEYDFSANLAHWDFAPGPRMTPHVLY